MKVLKEYGINKLISQLITRLLTPLMMTRKQKYEEISSADAND